MVEFTLPALGGAGSRFQTRENLQAEVRRAIDERGDALQTQIDALTSGVRIVGQWSAASGAFPTARPGGGAIAAGDAWVISAAGTVDGVAFTVGDRLIALGSGGATYAGNWQAALQADVFSGENTWTQTQTIANTAPTLRFRDTDSPADQKLAEITWAGGNLRVSRRNDAEAVIEDLARIRPAFVDPAETYDVMLLAPADRRFQRQFAVDLREFGDLTPGADHRPMLVAALAKCAAGGGGALLLPPGDINISAGIDATVPILGSGRAATRLVALPGCGRMIRSVVNDFSLRDLTVVGNYEAGNIAFETTTNVVRQSTSGVVFLNLDQIARFYYGFHHSVMQCWYRNIRTTGLEARGTVGLFVHGFWGDNDIAAGYPATSNALIWLRGEGATVGDTDLIHSNVGILIEPFETRCVWNFIGSKTIVDSSTTIGIEIRQSSNLHGIHGVWVEDAWVASSGTRAIGLTGAGTAALDGVTIVKNKLINNAQEAVFLARGENVAIMDNQFAGNNAAVGTNADVLVGAGVANTLCANNLHGYGAVRFLADPPRKPFSYYAVQAGATNTRIIHPLFMHADGRLTGGADIVNNAGGQTTIALV